MANAATLPAKGYMDAPADLSTVKGDLAVSGWFLDGSGVAKIEVMVDGKVIGQAQYGLERLDVQKAHPAYKNPNSGFRYVLDTRKLTNGNHSLTVRATGKNGVVTALPGRTVNVQNLPAKGSMDAPANGATLKGEIPVKGWFLNGSGVAKIEVLIDGKIMGQAEYGLSRADVHRAYPEYENANSGYLYNLNTRNLVNGTHSLAVRATALNGTTTTIKTIKVNVQNPVLSPRGSLDKPANNSIIKGDIPVSGWFLDGDGVARIEVLFDGKLIGNAEYGKSRLDVHKAYPDYENANSGFLYTLNSKNYSNGTHSLTVRGVSMDGTITNIKTVTVNIQNPNLSPRGSLDKPANNSTVKGDIPVSGWFLDGNGVARVEVLADGKIIGNAEYGIERLDVLKAYPDYENSNSGFSYTLNTKKFANGVHTLSVRGVNSAGTITNIKTVSMDIQNPQLITRGSVDEPANNSIIKGETVIRGWALDGSGIAKVEALLDGKPVGQAEYGLERLDVLNSYPEYENANSGYLLHLDTTSFYNGFHTLTVQVTNSNGEVKELKTIDVYVQNAIAPKASIDTPAINAVISGDTTVRGWALDGLGVSKLEILADGKVMGQAQYGLERLDVLKAYPEYGNTNSGYSYTLNTKLLNNGTHTISLRLTNSEGTSADVKSVTVNVQNEALPTKGSIDSPLNGTTIKDDTLVKGWILDGIGVDRVEILVDGILKGKAEYGLSRTDVYNKYPEYKNANSGYQFLLNTRTLTAGQHKLTIRVTRTNGTTYSLTNDVTVNNGNPYTLVNLKKPANITASDIVDFFNRKSPYSPLKNFAQDFIDAQNKYGVNAQYLVAHAIWETGWGGSDLRNYKHNLYGYGAYDVCPFTCGYYFPSGSASIDKVAYQVRKDYLEPTGAYYYAEYGPTLVGMNVKYATDQNWKNGIANLMESIKTYDKNYYSSRSEASNSGAIPPVYGRDIPDGQAYPTHTVLSFPGGITAKVNIGSLNFRSLPYVSSSTLIGTLSQNAAVEVLGYNTDVRYSPGSTGSYAFRWYRVRVNGQNGWLSGEYIDIANLLQVNAGGSTLNIRNNPSATNTTVLTNVADGTFLKIVLNNGVPVTQDGWYNVYLPNSTATGWVSGDFVNHIQH
ncbi:Ig-like domain-containing protein [Mesobacillus boroniphilus]|nr:Ig-like domain-containing protein [Mesobacillus boroniphilus]